MPAAIKWTEQETNFLKENYNSKGPMYCAIVLEKNNQTTKVKAQKLGLKYILPTLSFPTQKVCSGCKQLKDKSLFCKDKSSRDGLYCYCRDCRILQYKAFTPDDKARIHKNNQQSRAKRFKDPILRRQGRLLHSLAICKSRAKKKGMLFDLDFEWLNENSKTICPILNIPLPENDYNHRAFNCQSIDRIDNSKGYTKDNCVVVSLKANTIKNMSTIDELVKVATFYENLREERSINYSI
jgi:hypothetical protein